MAPNRYTPSEWANSSGVPCSRNSPVASRASLLSGMRIPATRLDMVNLQEKGTLMRGGGGRRHSGSCPTAPTLPGWPSGSALRLEVRLDEPQPPVDAARHLGEQGGRVRVVQLVGPVDGPPRRRAERRQGRR